MILLYVLILGSFQWRGEVYAQSCGNLTSRFVGTTAEIVLTPDRNVVSEMVKPNHGLRWNVQNGQTFRAVTSDSRVLMVDFTLRIREFGPYDEGAYFVDCRGQDSKEYKSQYLTVNQPGTIETSQVTDVVTEAATTRVNDKVPLGQSTDSEQAGVNTSIAIVVASLCVVIIVIVISGTIIFIRRNKTKPSEENKAFAITESSMTSRMAGDGESIYNEIDIEYESNRTATGGSRTPEDLKPLTLPKRPENKNKIENNYSESSKDNGMRDRSSSSVQNVYTEVGNVDKPQQPVASTSKDYMKMYATVVPKKHRINKDDVLDIQYLYAKPLLKKDRNETDMAQNDSLKSDQYNVAFPKIDVDALNTKMENVKRSDLVSMNEENFDAAVCRAGVYRSQKRKSSRRNELNYVELDHSGKSTAIVLGPQGSQTGEKMEYVAIDFDRKAFVAPARKPPSSWYKRKNKKKKKY